MRRLRGCPPPIALSTPGRGRRSRQKILLLRWPPPKRPWPTHGASAVASGAPTNVFPVIADSENQAQHGAGGSVGPGRSPTSPQQRQPHPAANGSPRSAAPANTKPHDDDEAPWSGESTEKTGPTQGWRGAAAKIGIKLSKSQRELDYDRDVHRIRRRLAYPHNVVVVSLKGGVGKSTAAVAIGSTLAKHRDVTDVVLFDSVTDGSLRQRMPREQNRSVTSDARQFLRSIPQDRKLEHTEMAVRLYSNPAGLQVLVAAQDINDYTLDVTEFHRVLSALHGKHMVNLIDVSPDRRVSTFWPAIQAAHAVVLVTTPTPLSVAGTKRFIDLLRESECKDLLLRTVLLWNDAAPGAEVVIDVKATKQRLVSHLSTQNTPSTCLVDIPRDRHLAASGEINLDKGKGLNKATRRQFERAAALLMDKMPDRAAHR